jgi:Immunoglobulin-like domain of bacterial spore germination
MTQTTHSPATPPSPPDGGGRSVPIVPIVLGLVAVVLVIAFVVAVDGDDDTEASSIETATTVNEPTTEATATTRTSESTTTAAPTTTVRATVSDAEAATIAWPAPNGDDAYDEPVVLATDFAEQILGFEDPVVGAYMEGDSRSGEVEVRPLDDGPVTTVGVRRMSDDQLYVLFAATEEVELLLPTPGSAIDHPLQVEGWGRGFEGQIRVAVFDRSTGDELGHGFFTAGGEGELAPFDGDLEWDNPGGGWGLVVAAVSGGDATTTWAATALPVGFIGGD